MTAPPVNIGRVESAKGNRMKKLLFLTLNLILAFGSNSPAADLKADLQKGLFEEEGNRNFEAAIERYQAVIAAFDQERAVAATALFRMAESFRKLGKTNEAAQAYQRVLRDFSDQQSIASLSRQALGPAAISGVAGVSVPEALVQKQIPTRTLARIPPSPMRAYVTGPVQDHSIVIPPDRPLTLYEAIVLANPTRLANLKKIRLSRLNSETGTRESQYFDFEALKKGASKDDPEMRDGDRIDVGEMKF